MTTHSISSPSLFLNIYIYIYTRAFTIALTMVQVSSIVYPSYPHTHTHNSSLPNLNFLYHIYTSSYSPTSYNSPPMIDIMFIIPYSLSPAILSPLLNTPKVTRSKSLENIQVSFLQPAKVWRPCYCVFYYPSVTLKWGLQCDQISRLNLACLSLDI